MAYEGNPWEALKVALEEEMVDEIEKIFSLLSTGQIPEGDFQELVDNDPRAELALRRLDQRGFNFRQFTI